MQTLSAEEAAELLHLNVKRVQSLARAGKLPAARVGRKWLFPKAELDAMLGTPARAPLAPTRGALALSARNRLRGRIVSLRVDGLMAEVVLKIGDQELVSMITRASVERMGLAVGEDVLAVVKSTEVMIGKPDGDA